jgi:predicted dehydrogenase
VAEPRSTRTIRVGVAGTGFAAASHLDALRRLPGVEVVAVAGSDLRRAQELAERFGVPRAYDDHLALVTDDAVEAVHNCTVNRRHVELSLAALRGERHVLSEKPLALDSDQSAALLEAAERVEPAGVVAAVCFNYRHYPLVAELRQMVASGEYGRHHLVHGSYLQDWLLLDSDWNWRLEPQEGGLSRAVADIGTHWADLVQHVVGEPIVEVLADLGQVHHTRLRPASAATTFSANGGDGECERARVETEDFGSVLFRLRSGARGVFTVSQTSAGRKNGLSFHVDAAAASFAWDQERPDRAWVGRRSQPNLELVRDAGLLHGAAAGMVRLPGGHPEGWADALTNAIADFHAAIRAARDGTPHDRTIASFREGHERVALVEAIVASHRRQRWTRVALAEDVAA